MHFQMRKDKYVPSNEPRWMEEHEDWVAEVVIDVGDDIENHQQRPDQVVLDMVWNKGKNMLSGKSRHDKIID